jgi:uncharacterized RDD family membrane protein YckC
MRMTAAHIAKLRLFAWLIDFLMVIGLGMLFYALGWAVSAGYWLLRDGLFQGQSVGKRIMRLQVVTERGEPCSLLRSFLRNALWVIPVVNAVTAITGLHYLLHDARGRHWGDRLAETHVVYLSAAADTVIDI